MTNPPDTPPPPTAATGTTFAAQWHYRPSVPIQTSPFFSFPPAPARIGRWLVAQWLGLTQNAVLVLVAIAAWLWVQPPLEVCRTLAFGWVAEMFVRNFVLMSAVAGGFHLYFYVWRRQGARGRFDERPTVASRAFTFGRQLYDNMFWTLGSGVAFWTGYEALMLWAMANGLVPVLRWDDNPIGFVALFFLTPIWISFHFYWIHRLIHWEPLYKTVHALHHRNTNVTPWSGLSMHPLEHLIFFSSVLVHWLVAAHPVHILYHMQHQALTGAMSHTGYDGVRCGDRMVMALGTFHHQMHHRYFTCNFGNLEVPLDRWFGSFHDGTPASHERFLAKRRRAIREAA